MDQLLVSIIIPTYNRAPLIKKTLDSILAQSYQHWECIVVDDGSIDDTKIIIEKYISNDSRFQYHIRPIERSKGPNSCRNYGFELSKGDYVNWFDSDDLYVSDALEIFVNNFRDDTDVVIAKLEIIDFLTGNKLKENVIVSDNLVEDYYTEKIAFYVSGPLWKRRFLEQQEQLFDIDISNLDDWDFNLRMLYQNPKIYFIDKILIQYVNHEKSLSKELGKFNFDEIQSELFAREKHLTLLKVNKKMNPLILNRYIKNRYKYFFREAMVRNHPKKYFLLKKLIRKQWSLYNYEGIVKTLFGFVFFSVFNKGYKILK